jgi:tetratricopeptide (TPR) repeat protein
MDSRPLSMERLDMNKFNVKLFLYLLGGTVLCAVALFLVHSFQSGRIADALLWQVRHAEEQGDLKGTAHYLGRYLEFEPNDLNERAHLGRTLADPKLANTWKSCQRALFALEHVVSQDPQRHELRKPLARVAIELGRLDLARSHLDVLAKALPGDGEVQFLCGQWHEAQAARKDTRAARVEFTRARKCYEQAITRSPKKITYYVRLASLFRHRLDDPKQAVEVLNRARRQAPNHAGVLLMSAGLAQEKQEFDTAWKYINQGRQRYPRNPKFCEAAASLYIEQNKRAQAIDCLRRGLNTLPSAAHPRLLWTLANLLLDRDEKNDGDGKRRCEPLPRAQLQAAGKEIARLGNVNAPPGQVEYLQARLCICRDEWSKAAQILERVRPTLVGSPQLTMQIDLFLGECYEHLDQPAQRLAAYQRAVKDDPHTLPLLTVSALGGLAEAQWAIGQREEALRTFQDAVAVPRAPPTAWLDYARRLIAFHRQEKTPRWNEVAQVLDQAEKAFVRAKQAPPIDLTLLRADALSAQPRHADVAEARLVEDCNRWPNKVELWSARILLVENRGETDRARQLLEEAERRLHDRVELRLARARQLVHREGLAARPGLERLGRNFKHFKPEEQSELLRGLAEASYRIGDLGEAARLLSRAADLPLHRKDLGIRLRLFDLYLQAKKPAEMGKVVEQVRRLEGEQGTWWRYGKASLLIWQVKEKQQPPGRLEEAEELLREVDQQRRDWLAVPLARAEIADLRGNVKEARERYQDAANLAQKSSSRVRRQLIEQGQSLVARGEPSLEAERKLRHAVAVASDAPETWVSLVQYLAATGQKEKAKQEIQKARELLGQTGEGMLALGQCYEAVGQGEEALQWFQEAAKSKSNDVAVIRGVANFYLRVGLTRNAEELLHHVMERKIKARDADVAWAKRGLALLWASGSNYPQFQKALPLVGLRLAGDGRVIEDDRLPPQERDETQRARARVLASQGSRPFRTRAIAYLEDLARRKPLPPDDQFLLASLYEAQGEADWPRAEKLMHALLAGDGANPTHLAHFAQGLILRGKLKEAEPYLARLERLEKIRGEAGTLGSVELRARALEVGGAPDRAQALLQSYAAGKNADPRKVLTFAAFLARRNRLTEALDQCQRAWQTDAPPEVVGGACVAALRSGQPTPGQCARVERWLREALDRKPDRPTLAVLQVQLADLFDLRGRYQEAEALYRQVLKEDPDNVMALNNLAWLLAYKRGKAAEGLRHINHAIEVLGPRAELLDTRAVVYLAQGEAAPAIADLERATADAPSPGRYFHLARAFKKARQSTRALDAFKKARAAGLELKRLHPAERAAYDRIANQLDQR